jgi:hypothetical protein
LQQSRASFGRKLHSLRKQIHFAFRSVHKSSGQSARYVVASGP